MIRAPRAQRCRSHRVRDARTVHVPVRGQMSAREHAVDLHQREQPSARSGVTISNGTPTCSATPLTWKNWSTRSCRLGQAHRAAAVEARPAWPVSSSSCVVQVEAALQHPHDVRVADELGAEARRVPGGAGRELVLLRAARLPGAAPPARRWIGDAAARDAAADDRNAHARLHALWRRRPPSSLVGTLRPTTRSRRTALTGAPRAPRARPGGLRTSAQPTSIISSAGACRCGSVVPVASFHHDRLQVAEHRVLAGRGDALVGEHSRDQHRLGAERAELQLQIGPG